MNTQIPDTAQEVFDAVVAARAIPWLPRDGDDVPYLTWQQLVRENRVPNRFAGLIHGLQRIADNERALRDYARRHGLEYPECTPSST